MSKVILFISAPSKSQRPLRILKKVLVSFVVIVQFLVATPSASLASTIDLPNLQTYQIKREYITETQKVLLVTAFYQGEYTEYHEKKYDTFAQIVTSHWNVDITLINEADYKLGMIEKFDTLFYIKENRETVPLMLTRDIALAQNKQIILTGFTTDLIAQILNHPLSAKDVPISFIDYKDVRFTEDTEVFLTFDTTEITELPGVTETFGSTVENATDAARPFAFSFTNQPTDSTQIQSNYLALPFILPDYYTTNSYSTVFLDLLYEGFGEDSLINKKTALLRLEDVNVHTYHQPKKLVSVYEFLKSEEIPFHIAFIVKYINPLENIEMRTDEARRFNNLLNRMVGEGYGTLVQHGYTHQINSSVSGAGFEFWDEDTNSPLTSETGASVLERIRLAQFETEQLGLPVPDIWETPHYAASDIADAVFSDVYPLRYEHAKGVGSLPFPILLNGTIYIPETLGFISDGSDIFIDGQDIDSVATNLEYLNVFRDGTASIFWHPWRDITELKFIVNLLQDNGYTFVSAYDLVEQIEPKNTSAMAALSTYRADYQQPLLYTIGNYLIVSIYAFFILGCILYLRTIFRLKKYAKVFDNTNYKIEELLQLVNKNSIKLPKFAIFVPARNEGLVIGNTIQRLANIDYPKDSYKVFVIVDERELDDEVPETTKSVVQRIGNELNTLHNTNLISYIEVPKWYSGVFGDVLENSKKSTKGRALNYALQTLETEDSMTDIDMICVLDADGRLHPDALKEAAYKRMTSASKVLQGPVLQVSNFANVSLVGIAAGIELAIHHLSELPHNLLESKRVQFLAGTNYFIDKNLITKVGGWDQDSLVEDAELALRIYIKTGVRANWMGSPEIEQTPENFTIYKKQRRRWVRGHLDLIKTIQSAPIPFSDKLLFFWKIFTSQFRFILDIGFPLLAITFLLLGMFVDLGTEITVVSIILLIFAAFMWDMYGYVYRRLNPYIKKNMTRSEKIKMSLKLFFFSPVFMFTQSIPRMLALVDYARSAPTNWYKTERTAEKPIT